MIAVFFSWIIKGYQRLISPLLPPACRFHPSCSQYAVEALRSHGALSGGAMAAHRILRCNPLFQGGIDMVPAPRGETRAN
jgi:putative membrane protein insertion efficiency factor